MTKISGACDSFDSDGNTILVGSDDNECIFIFRFEVIKVTAEDKIIFFMSLEANNLVPNAIIVGENYRVFSSD